MILLEAVLNFRVGLMGRCVGMTAKGWCRAVLNSFKAWLRISAFRRIVFVVRSVSEESLLVLVDIMNTYEFTINTHKKK